MDSENTYFLPKHLTRTRDNSSVSSEDSETTEQMRSPYNPINEQSPLLGSELVNHGGLTTLSAAIFVAGEMAGSGVLALPRALVDLGWTGLVLLIVFCINSGYSGARLGDCWTMIEERYPEHRTKSRNPYAVIAEKAVGAWGRKLVTVCVQTTLFGVGTVYLLIASQMVKELFQPYLPNISFCLCFVVFTAALTPVMWLGSPKDFWKLVTVCVQTTLFGVGTVYLLIASQMVKELFQPYLPNISFCLCFVVFTAALTPVMWLGSPKDFCFCLCFVVFTAALTPVMWLGSPKDFWVLRKTLLTAHVHDHRNDYHWRDCTIVWHDLVSDWVQAILALYIPVGFGGFLVYGESVNANIILSLGKTSLATFANIFMACHLILAFFIVINPVAQQLEETFFVPNRFCVKRCLLRTCMIIVMIIIGETVPSFGMILSLIGGSTVTLTTFILPSYFYMKLCDQTVPGCPVR
ncbi:amino acid transporter AVT1J [Diaphorina citri]|uniref:Amino acid transporter AVT1J n=1 Tax=Diaphorina citri TaxID=121845 RepID=A0A3Q0J569_DIACI|nr:amino acid transporter AVT1J [Diaphorina citri]